MVQSPEYPDLLWMPPRSWTNANRTNVQVIVIHDTEGTEGINSAENGASYDQRRTDGTSTHYFHDQDSTVQCVRTEDVAHAARANGNRIGIQHELCGRASQGAAGWADEASQGTIRNAAAQTARDCLKWGIPPRKLTPAQVRAGAKGICGHGDITRAFPEDSGDHTDPGPTFPWDQFINLVELNMAGLTNDDADVVINRMVTRMKTPKDAFSIAMKAITWQYDGGGLQGAASSLAALADTQTIQVMVTALAAAVARITDVDEVALGNQIIAGLVNPLKAAILDALPDDLDAAVRESVESSVEDVAGRFRLQLQPPANS